MSYRYHQAANTSSGAGEFGINGWDAEIDLGALDNTANNVEYVPVEYDMHSGVEMIYRDIFGDGGDPDGRYIAIDGSRYDSLVEEIPNRIVIIDSYGKPIEIERFDINEGVGMEIFDYMEEQDGPNIHEILWNPDTLYQWCVAVCHIGSWINKKGGLAMCRKAAFVFGAARFGQAVMFGADRSALRVAWEEIENERFRGNADWYKLINPKNDKMFQEEVPGSNLYTRVPIPSDKGYGYETKEVLDNDLLCIACYILEGWCTAVQERQKRIREMVRKQAIIGIVCTKDLKKDDQRCAICLESFAASTNDGEGTNAAHIAVRTTCRHLFGLSCFNNWMKCHENCPLCRQKLIGNDRLPHPRDQAFETVLKEERTAGNRKVDKKDVQTIREGLLAWDGLTLDPEQHAICTSLIIQGRTRDAYDIMLQQLQTLRAVDNITGGPLCPILTSCPSLKFLVCGSFRDDWGNLHRNARRLIDMYSGKAGNWSAWTDLQIKDLKRMSIECNRRLK
jgi:Ring finger domain